MRRRNVAAGIALGTLIALTGAEAHLPTREGKLIPNSTQVRQFGKEGPTIPALQGNTDIGVYGDAIAKGLGVKR